MMQTNISCTARRRTCDILAQNLVNIHHVRDLGFKSCVRGTHLGIPRITRQPSFQRRHSLQTQAFVVPPALIKIAQRVAFRGAAGRLLLEVPKKGGWRVAAPLTAALFVYSVVATWFAARQTKELNKVADSNTASLSMDDGVVDRSFLASETASTTSQTSLSSVDASAEGAACPICQGRGTITWDRFEVHEGAVCPRCLGTGSAKKRTVFFKR